MGFRTAGVSMPVAMLRAVASVIAAARPAPPITVRGGYHPLVHVPQRRVAPTRAASAHPIPATSSRNSMIRATCSVNVCQCNLGGGGGFP